MMTKIKKKITAPYTHSFRIKKSGLVAIFISARCKSKQQIKSNIDEDLRVEINGASFRELQPEKYIQQYNIPASFNGSKLKGLKKTVVFFAILKKGENEISLIPKTSAFVESIEIQEMEDQKNISLTINEQAEDGDRRPWFTFILVFASLESFTISAEVQYRFGDSDDIKIIIDGAVQKQKQSYVHRFWVFAGNVIKKIKQKKAQQEKTFFPNLSKDRHYIEIWADRTPKLNSVAFKIEPHLPEEEQSENQKTPQYIIEKVQELYKEISKTVRFDEIPAVVDPFTEFDKEIQSASKEFNVDSIILKATIAQESSFGKQIDHDYRYVGESGLMGMEKEKSIATLKRLGYDFDYENIFDVIRASAAYYDWLKDRPTTFIFKGKENPLKLYTQYRIDTKAEKVDAPGIKQFLYYYFYYQDQ